MTPQALAIGLLRRRRQLKVLFRFLLSLNYTTQLYHSIIAPFRQGYLLQKSDKILFQTLRDEIRYINVFVIAFKQTDTRMTYALRSMISLFEKMFGDGFWDNAILEVPESDSQHIVYSPIFPARQFTKQSSRQHIGPIATTLLSGETSRSQ